MDDNEIVISEIYCFRDLFLYAFLDILHITATQKHMLHFLSETPAPMRCKIIVEIGKALEYAALSFLFIKLFFKSI